MYRPLSFAVCRGVLMSDMTDESGRIASSVPARNPDHAFACSSDRKRWIRLQARGQFRAQSLIGISMYPTMLPGFAFSITPFRTEIRIDSPQSRQGESTSTVLFGKTQQTARASKPH
jgi:hypothetical protein